MKKLLLTCLLFASSASAYERLQGPTELLFCDKAKALPGYVLFGVGSRTFLLNLDGNPNVAGRQALPADPGRSLCLRHVSKGSG